MADRSNFRRKSSFIVLLLLLLKTTEELTAGLETMDLCITQMHFFQVGI